MNKRHMLSVAAAVAAAGLIVGASGRPAGVAFAADPQVEQARQAEQAADALEDRADRIEQQADRLEERAEEAADRAEDQAEARAEREEDRAEQAREAGEAAALAAAAATFPAGIEAEEVEDAGGIRNTLEGLTEATVKGDFSDVVERLVDQDRNRIGEWLEAREGKDEQFTAAQEAFRAAWEQKYGTRDFEVEPDQAFATVGVVQGEITDPELVAANWPLNPTAAAEQPGAAVPAAAEEAAETPRAEGELGDQQLQSNLEKGRDVAAATFPAGHGAPALNVSLIQELQGWRVDAPNTLTGEQLRDSLVQHLQHLTTNADQWPADQAEAQEMVAHHVLAAVYGLDAASGQAGAGVDAAPPAAEQVPATDPGE